MEVKKRYVAIPCGSCIEGILYGVSFQYMREVPTDATIVGYTDFSEVSSISDELTFSCTNKSVCVAVMPSSPEGVDVLGYICVGDNCYVQWCTSLACRSAGTRKILVSMTAIGIAVVTALVTLSMLQEPKNMNTTVNDELLVSQKFGSDRDRSSQETSPDVELDSNNVSKISEQKETVIRQKSIDSAESTAISSGSQVDDSLVVDASGNDADKSSKKQSHSQSPKRNNSIARSATEPSYHTDTGNIPHTQTFTDIAISAEVPTYVLTNGNSDAVGNIHYEMDIRSGREILKSLTFDLAPTSSQEINLYKILTKGKYEVCLTTEYSKEEFHQYNADSTFMLIVK